MRNLLLIALGMTAYYLFGHALDWAIVGMIGIVVASTGLFNLILTVYPFRGNYTDWLLPLLATLVFGLLLANIRSGNFMNVDTTGYIITEGLALLATFSGVVRLYIYVCSKIGFFSD